MQRIPERRHLGMCLSRSVAQAVARSTLVLVVVTAAIVYAARTSAAETYKPPSLPPHVEEMREAIAAAARTGDLEELRSVLEMGTDPPDLGIGGANDPIAALKANSADGQGRDILAAIVQCLSLPPAALPLGNDIENNLIYIWPYLAARPLDKLSPPEEVDLYRLMTPAKGKEMRDQKKWLWWRLVIGADGSWLTFKQDEPAATK